MNAQFETPVDKLFKMQKKRVLMEFSEEFWDYYRCFFRPQSQITFLQYALRFFTLTDTVNKMVLDVGCGYGLLSIAYSMLVAKEVICIDFNISCIQI